MVWRHAEDAGTAAADEPKSLLKGAITTAPFVIAVDRELYDVLVVGAEAPYKAIHPLEFILTFV
jgi:hypothetical protein